MEKPEKDSTTEDQQHKEHHGGIFIPAQIMAPDDTIILENVMSSGGEHAVTVGTHTATEHYEGQESLVDSTPIAPHFETIQGGESEDAEGLHLVKPIGRTGSHVFLDLSQAQLVETDWRVQKMDVDGIKAMIAEPILPAPPDVMFQAGDDYTVRCHETGKVLSSSKFESYLSEPL